MRTPERLLPPRQIASRPRRAARATGAPGVWPDGPEEREKLRVERLSILALLAAFGGLYAPIAAGTLADCWRDENYSHGVIVPLLVFALARARHHDVFVFGERTARRLEWLAWGLFAAGCAAFVVGSAASEWFTLRVSGVFVLAGLCGILGGPLRLRRYGPPLLLLLGTIPLPYVVFYQISFPLQLVSARLAAGGLTLMGLDVTRNGNIFEVGGQALEVVGACSGIRSMMALATLGVAGAVALRLGVWRGTVLGLAALPAAMLGNLLRLLVTALLVLRFGPGASKGLLHEGLGLLSFMASLALLAALAMGLQRGRPRPSAPAHGILPRFEPEWLRGWLRTLRITSPRSAWIALAVFAVAGGYGSFLRAHAAVPHETPRLSALPLEFEGLSGRDVPLDDRVLDKLSPESYVFRTYDDAAGGHIGLYVAYYRDPREGAQIHSPMHCYPGAGWRILDSRRLQIRTPDGEPTRMQRLLVEKHGRRDVVVYWYDTRIGRLTNDFELKLNLMQTALLHRPQDAAFVRWSAPLEEGEPVEAATRRLLSAVARAYPQITAALPFEG